MGYQNLDTIADGYKMLTGTFANIADADGKITMRDLTVKGVNVTWSYKMKKWNGGIPGGAFCVTFLGKSGAFEKTYYWLWTRTGDEANPVDNMRWCKHNGETYVDLTDAELDEKIPAGQGLWILGSGHQLVPAGAVSAKDIEFETITDGYRAIGNGTPVELTLGDLTVTGVNVTWSYKMKKWNGGIPGGAFCVTFLGKSGAFEKTYYWLWTRTGDEANPVDNMRWCKHNGETYVDLTDAELDEIKIPAGQALWVLGSGHKLNVPAPEL